jgi:zinc protease
MTKQSFPGPNDITRVVLDNGIVVLVRENHAAPVTVLEGHLPVGAIHDPHDKIGLSSFVTAMLTRGSANYAFDAFNEAIESIGASLAVTSETHAASFGTTSLSEDFPCMVEILADTLRRPTFPSVHIERVRQQKLVSIQEREQDTQRVAGLRFYETIYPQHPYGQAISGYKETVGAIQRNDLLDFYQRHYTPNGAVIAVVGDVQTSQVLDLLSQALGDWRGPVLSQRVPVPDISQAVKRLTIPMAGKVQSDIVIGCPAVSRYHPDYYAIRVANTILGRFGMMGRLGERVREEQGLAYYCYSTQDAELGAGVWLAEAGVNPANVQQAVDSILAEFERLGSELVSEQELSDSQAYMTGVLPLTLETNDGVASTLLNMEWYGLGLDYLLRYNDLVYGVSAADVQRVARTYLRNDNYTLVVAGPADEE